MEPIQVTLRIVFAVLAFVLFVLAGLGVPEKPNFHYGWWGLAFLTLAFFLLVRLN
jgi:NhaP-type Na+/H+ or K+/H+ antiporter